MTLRDLLRTLRRLAPALLVLVLLAACGGDDDDPTATTVSSGGTAETTATSDDDMTTSTAEEDATGAADDDDATGTADEMATGTAEDDDATETAEDDDATGTADDGMATGTAEEDATGAAEDDAGTGTADSGSTDDPLAELGDVTALENYTLVAEGTFNFTASGAQDFTMEVQQSAPDNYRFLVDIVDLTTMEVWAVTDTLFVQLDGGPTQEMPFTPDAVTGQFNPGFYLTQFQQPEFFDTAEIVGEEEINGRTTTHYTFTAEQWSEAATAQGLVVEEVEGEGGDIWIDNELSVIVRLNTDLSWTDGTTGQIFEQVMTWDVTNIDATAPVEPPSS